ncbi:MAG TPA: nuclear transport factor 2 family protein [Candidatus Sumerlaeota bacterium]|nr:nuclear transport factor 2 family protein [Candidatus Sumerlaeota bacterium]HPS03101.1 nuclear transport factor 2 family protein [Candidatus Sumerlaeota bacterium]
MNLRWMRMLWVALMIVYLAMNSMAQETGTENDREADHTALRTLLKEAAEALNNRELDKLTDCFTDNFVLTAVDQTVLTDRAAIKAYYEKMLCREDSPVSSFHVAPKAEILTQFVDTNTGYCYGTSEDIYTVRKNGRQVTMASRWTALVVKREGHWKIAAIHSGVNFLDNPVLTARTLPWWRKLFLAVGIGKYPGEK